MLFNTSYKNEDYVKESNHMLGKTYSFMEKLKMRGVGSSRFIIEELSISLTPEHMQKTAINYASIELRPKGVLILFSNRLDRYSWIIPYYRLIVFNTEVFSIHSNGKFMKFQKDRNFKANKEFIDKMMNLKNAFLNLDYYDA